MPDDAHLRRFPYIQTFTGAKFSYEEPGPFRMRDIAHALAMIPRFNGHVVRHYSVAEHSVLVSRMLGRDGVEQDLTVAGLLHDAHEAYIGDIPSPLKWACPEIKGIEGRVERALRAKLTPNISAEVYENVKAYDLMALHIEAKTLLVPIPDWVRCPGNEAPWSMLPLGRSWKRAEEMFLLRAEELGLAIG